MNKVTFCFRAPCLTWTVTTWTRTRCWSAISSVKLVPWSCSLWTIFSDKKRNKQCQILGKHLYKDLISYWSKNYFCFVPLFWFLTWTWISICFTWSRATDTVVLIWIAVRILCGSIDWMPASLARRFKCLLKIGRYILNSCIKLIYLARNLE